MAVVSGRMGATPRPTFRPVDGGRPPRTAPADTAVIGMLIFLATEVMFFAGLVSAFLILRGSADVWPPPGQPRLPVELTGLNTLGLLVSAFTMRAALVAARTGRDAALVRNLSVTAALGATFVAVQGVEWIRLLGHGLSAVATTYGATFYTLIGAHGLHVLGGLVAVLVVLARARRGRYTARRHVGVSVCALYWLFVVAVWPVLYVSVYLA